MLYGPSVYTASTDSPFSTLVFDYRGFDDFESATRTPGYASTSGGQVGISGPFSDSVDADDGVSDGSGANGHSWFSGGTTNTFTFAFDAGVLGRLPTHVGLVWTDVGNVTSGTPGYTDVSFSAFGPTGDLLATIPGTNLGDGSAFSAIGDDRFFGIASLDGISRVQMTVSNSVDWEVDHLQFGAISAVPEPEQWLLMALGVAAAASGVRRRR